MRYPEPLRRWDRCRRPSPSNPGPWYAQNSNRRHKLPAKHESRHQTYLHGTPIRAARQVPQGEIRRIPRDRREVRRRDACEPSSLFVEPLDGPPGGAGHVGRATVDAPRSRGAPGWTRNVSVWSLEGGRKTGEGDLDLFLPDREAFEERLDNGPLLLADEGGPALMEIPGMGQDLV